MDNDFGLRCHVNAVDDFFIALKGLHQPEFLFDIVRRIFYRGKLPLSIVFIGQKQRADIVRAAFAIFDRIRTVSNFILIYFYKYTYIYIIFGCIRCGIYIRFYCCNSLHIYLCISFKWVCLTTSSRPLPGHFIRVLYSIALFCVHLLD